MDRSKGAAEGTIELSARGDVRVVLHDGTRLALSRSHRDQLGELLDG